MPPPEKPLPRPKPKPKPKPPKPKPKPPKPPKPIKRAEPVRVQSHRGVPFPPDPFACAAECTEQCAYYRLCPPPPPSSRAATVHLRSSRLPTPLIALSASVLAVTVVLLAVLLVCHVVRRRTRRRRQQQQQQQQDTPLAHLVDEGAPVAAAEEEGDGAGPGVHHVWYIRTVGLDERSIAAITALVYDAKKCRGGGGDDDGSCAVCLAEFRDGETLRLLPRCRHAFHRGCIDPWLRAHVNCPLCRAPVQVASAKAVPGATTAAPGGGNASSLSVSGAVEAVRDGAMPERAVRRAASMVALPRLPWPDASLRAPASSSWREGETGLVKVSRLLKLSEALEMAGVGVGRSVSFGARRAASCQHFPGRSGPSAAGTNADEVSR